MLKVEQVGEHDWEFVYPPKYHELMDKFDEGFDLWEDPEIKEWLIRNTGKGKRSKLNLP
jgi:hypothetical protein